MINQRGLVAVDTLELSQNGIIADTSMILFDTTWILYQGACRLGPLSLSG